MPEDLTPYVPRLLLKDLPVGPSSRDGTLVFVDISGFTAMSERLAAHGKVGAEEVTDVLNATFSDLLEIAYSAGGSLLKFGGDALLLFFEGPGHPVRGAWSASEMRARLRSNGKITTSAGNVTLRMSVGVNSGEFDFFLCGNSHQELIVTGPAASTTVALETAAGAGDVLVSPETARLLDPSVLGAAKGSGLLMIKSPELTEAVPMFDPIPHGELAERYIPLAIRELVREGGNDPEHRNVAVAFIRFSGTDVLINRGRSQEAFERIDSFVRSIQDVVETFGICFLGSDINSDGGKIILTAGAPVAFGDDNERILRALRSIFDRDHGLVISAGVNAGHVFAGAVGPHFRRTYTVMGDAVNSAARLMSAAGANDIYAAPSALDRCQALFKLHKLEPLRVKGKAKPLPAFKVLGIEGRRGGPSLNTPLVGREAELSELIAGLEAARQGRKGSSLLVGEPGFGKTRIVEELKSRAAGMNVLSIWCDQYRQDTPYFAIRLLLRRLLGIGDSDRTAGGVRLRSVIADLAPGLMPWVPLLALAADVEAEMTPEVAALDKEFVRERLARVVVDASEALLDGPSLFAIDDIQWLDEGSAFVLERMIDQLQSPWFFCLTTRGSSTINVDRMLELGPLDHTAAVALARVESSDQLLPQAASKLAEKSGGNPMFLRELVAAHRYGEETDALPTSIEALITARIDRLKPADRRVLRLASVLGITFQREMLQRAVAAESAKLDDHALMRLQEFLEPQKDLMRFRQALMQQVAYEALPFRTRKRMHSAVAHELERLTGSDEQPEVLSMHYHLAADFEKSWEFSRVAAVGAAEKFSYSVAAELYQRALEAARALKSIPQSEVAETWEALGDAQQGVGRFDLSANSYRKARRLVESTIGSAHLLQREGAIHERLGNFSMALRSYNRALKLLELCSAEKGVVEERARLLLGVALIRRRRGQFGEAIRLAQSAQNELEAIGNESLLATAYAFLYTMKSITGEQAGDLGKMALDLYERSGQLRFKANMLNSLAVVAKGRGDWHTATAMYNEALQLSQAIGHDLGAAVIAMNIAELLIEQGRFSEVESLLDESLSTLTAAKASIYLIENKVYRSRLFLGLGRGQDAEHLLKEVIDDYKSIGATGKSAETRLAEALLLQGRVSEALSITSSVVDVATPLLRPLALRVHGWGLLLSGATADAKARFVESLELARSRGLRYEEALTLEALAAWAKTEGSDSANYAYLSEQILQRLGVTTAPATPLVV